MIKRQKSISSGVTLHTLSPEAAYSTNSGLEHLVLSSNLGHAAKSVLPDGNCSRVDHGRCLGLNLIWRLSGSGRSTLRPISQARIGWRSIGCSVLSKSGRICIVGYLWRSILEVNMLIWCWLWRLVCRSLLRILCKSRKDCLKVRLLSHSSAKCNDNLLSLMCGLTICMDLLEARDEVLTLC